MIRNFIQAVIRGIGNHYTVLGGGFQIDAVVSQAQTGQDSTLGQTAKYSAGEGLEWSRTQQSIRIGSIANEFIFRPPNACNQCGIQRLQQALSEIQT
jgi:hypothetical protein